MEVRGHAEHKMQQTSLQAYDELKQKLGERQSMIFNNIALMHKYGLTPATDREIADYIGFKETVESSLRENTGISCPLPRDQLT